MEYHKQVDAFANELDDLILRFQSEWDLLNPTIMGLLDSAKIMLADPMFIDLGGEMLEDEDEGEEQGKEK